MSPGFSPSNSAVIDMDGNPFWIVSSESWLPRLFSGVTMKVIPSSCNIGSQNVIVFPEPVTEIDTMLFLASNLNATLHFHLVTSGCPIPEEQRKPLATEELARKC